MLRSRHKSKMMSIRSDNNESLWKVAQRCLTRSPYVFKRSFLEGTFIQYAMKSVIRENGISAPETSDDTSGRQVLRTCANSDLGDLGRYPFLSGKTMLRLFHAEVASSSL